MPVKSEVEPLLAMMNAAEVPLADQTPESLREAYAALGQMVSRAEVASVVDRTCPGPAGDVPVRVYRPAGSSATDVLPVVVWFHGGGWVIGDLETADPTVRDLANAAGVAVVSVDYRLAPEHPFPAALDDALAAVRWVAQPDVAAELGVDPARLAVAGDSAGGNLAAVVAQQLGDDGPGIRFQLLVYPVTDLRMDTESYEANAEGYFLTRETMQWFRAHYLGDAPVLDDPRWSPLAADDAAFAGLPPALVITAEFDPLRDEGEAYGTRLAAAGVDTTTTRYDGMIHGFFSMADFLPDGRAAITQAAESLKRYL
jgi:acetyl esterase